MKNIIVGTAGHIDHGKTSLVGALTGMDTDRLKEEKERGISIELGFAHCEGPGGEKISFVDVPGHERFVRTMLAGVSGIDVVLLVIAADEVIKPQTREHFEICRLLGLKRGVVALTKADLVDAEWLELVRLEVEEFVRGSFLEGAPVVAVSAKTGLGREELLRALVEVGAGAKAVESWPPRLPVDRVFTLKGHGTVVTGTLRGGRLRVEEEVELYPLGRRVRVRSIQVHGKSVKQAEAGQRTALNLAGVEVNEVERGMVVGPVGALAAVRLVDVELQLLKEARGLRDRARVHFHSGTVEIAAEVRLLSGSRRMEAGETEWVRLALDRETLLLPGDRFILRTASPLATVGGGVVAEIHPGAARLRRKGAAARLTQMQGMTVGQKLERLVAERRLGVEFGEVRARLGCREEDIPKEVERAGTWLVTRENLKRLAGEVVERLRQHHRDAPLEAGLSREYVRSTVLGTGAAPLFELVLKQAPAVKAEGELLRLESHRVQLSGAQDSAAQMMEERFEAAGLAVPAVGEVLAGTGLPEAQAKAVLAVLLRDHKLVRVGPELVFHAGALEQLTGLLREKRGQRFSVGEFKAWTGVSRKYAIPLLEYLDRLRLTRRDGDARVVV
jgi:selenocysteine-specific elongation factor